MPPTVCRHRTILFKSGLFVLGVVAALTAAEVIIRSAAPQVLAVPYQDHAFGVSVPRPNIEGRVAVPGAFDVHLSVGPQRFRGRRLVSEIAPEGTIRLALLGDSTTFGVGAGDDDTYPAELERRLTARGTFGGVEVINAGNPWSGTGNEALWYDRYVSRFKPDVVVLNVFWNDLQDDTVRRLFTLDDAGRAIAIASGDENSSDRLLGRLRRWTRRSSAYEFTVQHSHLLSLARRSVSVMLASTDADVAQQTPSAEATRLFASEIAWLHERVASRGGQFVLVLIPGRESVIDANPADAPVLRKSGALIGTALGELAAKRGLPYLDLTPLLRQRTAPERRALYYQGAESHPTATGYAAIAEGVSSFVENRFGKRLQSLASVSFVRQPRSR